MFYFSDVCAKNVIACKKKKNRTFYGKYLLFEILFSIYICIRIY